MAASSSATSSSLVDLGAVAELDTATSAFFGDGGADFSQPTTEQAKSVLTSGDQLQMLCNKYSIPKEYMPILAGDAPACAPPTKWGSPSRAAIRKPVASAATAAAISKLHELAGKDELEKANAARAADVGRLVAELEARGGTAPKARDVKTEDK